ncbi:MAG: LptA/OstA family protein, partial [Verrucomicrobiota bacterium]|nr:LptA/OstA family protein [Verrucomicrobiota bacterium]
LFLISSISPLHSQEKTSKERGRTEEIDATADKMEFKKEENIFVGKGNVKISYGDILIKADKATINIKTNQIIAEGNVYFIKDAERWQGEKIVGNIATGEFAFDDFLVRTGPWYIVGTSGKRLNNQEIHISKGKFSTCAYVLDEYPKYSITSTKLKIYPDNHFVAYNCVFRLGRLPVFYLPFVRGGANDDQTFQIETGYDGDWGAYMLLARKYKVNEKLTTTMMYYFRMNHGFAIGNETSLKTEKTNTNLYLYGMKDDDAPETTPNFNKRFDVEDNRYRAKLTHRSEFTKNLTLRLNADKLSDIDMLEDWFENDYDTIKQPVSLADLTWTSPFIELSLNYRPRINDFYTVVEKKPELLVNTPRIQIGESGFFYASETQLANLEMKWRDVDKNRLLPALTDPQDYDSWRFNTTHSIYRPMQHNGWLNIIPRMSVGLTYYSNSSDGDVTIDDLNAMIDIANPDNVEGLEPLNNIYDDNGNSVLRLAGELGLEMSFKKYKTLHDYKNAKLHIDGLRHIVQPYINITALFEPTEDKDNLYFFDETDRLQKSHFVRLGMKQRFQTKRNKEIYTFAAIENYADIHFGKHDEQKILGNFGTKAEFKPHEELSLWTKLIIDMGSPDLNEASFGASIGKKETFLTTISYLYRNNYRVIPTYSLGSTLTDYSANNLFERRYDDLHSISLQFDFPITQLTSSTIEYIIDIKRNRLAEQSYMFKKDFDCLVGAIRLRESYGVIDFMFMLYIKAIPSLKIKG